MSMENLTQSISGLQREKFQKNINGKYTDLFLLQNAQGHEVAITNYGGTIVGIMVPDKNGKLANIIQGHDCIEDCLTSPEPFLSTLIGRYGNRICNGQFTMNNKLYKLAVNNGPNHLHGGPTGFHSRVWDAEQVDNQSLILRYTSAYYEEGFPGELKMTVMYTFTDDDELILNYRGTTNKKTVVNMTHHGFFSLAGIGNPTPGIENIECMINADYYVPIDENSIPTGEIRKVEGTPFDFRTMHAIGRDIDADNEQIKNGTEPGVQFYTDNWADGYKGQFGATFPRRSAICFEAQHFPDSPNRSYFPPVVLKPGELYIQKTIYKFGIAE